MNIMERRAHNFKDLTGKTFGNLTVLRMAGQDKGHRIIWECLCNCGKKCFTMGCRLNSGRAASCGCSHNSRGTNNPKWEGYGKLPKTHFNDYLHSAKKRNIEFSISIEDAWNKFEEQGGRCAISGVLLEFYVRRKDKSSKTASLDRIDSSKGYILDNIQWIHKDINIMKLDYSMEEFIEWCKIITENNNNVKQRDTGEA